MHVHQPQSQVCKPGESLALRKVQYPHNGRTSVNRFPLTKQDILSQYSGCFEGIGRFPGDLYKFHLKPDHKPARHAPRKVPVHLETAFKEEIDSLVSQGILEEVKEHTDWVNSYVIVEKDTGNSHAPNHTVKKKLRICLDPRDLNEALEREPYHTRSVDEITAKLQGMTVFTIVDFKKGYWMVVLHPDSRKLTCMALPFGRFQWTHLPMGTVVAQDIFQSKLDAIFIGMEGVTGIADDMIIAGKDEMEQGSMTSEEFHSHVLQIVKRCQFPNQEAEERAVRDAIFIGMNSQQARDKAINLMNEEGKEVTVEFLMNHLAVEDGNTQHKFLSQINSSSSVNMIAYDRRQNRGKSYRGKQNSGRNGAHNKTRVQASSSTVQLSRKPPGMEGKCMRCGKPDHQQGQKCAAKNAKCKECHKIGHFYKVCQSKKRTR